MLRFQFVLGRGLSSQAIAWFSAGHFSHVDCVLPSGELLGARSDRIGHVAAGVQIRPPFYERWKERVVIAVRGISYAQEQKFYQFLYAQLGKPYDSTAIWGFVSGRDWRAQDSWFCSELQTAALEAIEFLPLLYTPRNKVTPAALATVLSAVGGMVVS